MLGSAGGDTEPEARAELSQAREWSSDRQCSGPDVELGSPELRHGSAGLRTGCDVPAAFACVGRWWWVAVLVTLAPVTWHWYTRPGTARRACDEGLWWGHW
jgi:hypothetical protein